MHMVYARQWVLLALVFATLTHPSEAAFDEAPINDDVDFMQETKSLEHRGSKFLAAVPPDVVEAGAASNIAPEGELALLSKKAEAALQWAQDVFESFPGRLPDEAPKTTKELFVEASERSIVYILFVCCIGYLYINYFKSAKADEALMEEQSAIPHGFQFGICDTRKCGLNLCLFSCCCPCIRWPTTVSNAKLGLIRFWPALLLFAVLFSLQLWWNTAFALVLLCVQIYYRQGVRAKYDLDNGTCMTVTEDCLVWTFCIPCAMGQEARQVEYVQLKETNA